MGDIAVTLKTRLLGSGGTTSGVLGGIGSIHNVCHSLCMALVSILAVFGISMNILPLMFLQTYQMYFWLGALVFTLASLHFYLQQRLHVARDRNLLFINVGLLLFGLPFHQLADYMDFFRFAGGSLAIIGLFLILFGKRFKAVYRPFFVKQEGNASVIQLPKLSVTSLLFALIIGSFLINQYLMYRMRALGSMASSVVSTTTSAMQTMSRMKFAPFDVAMAKERMDKNNDGICDSCGMPIQQCIDSGQLDCNMGNNPQAIGVLGSQHIHADFKVYVNGQALDFAKPEYYMKSSFMHVDNSENREDSSSVLHMHAKKVPAWLFFRSIGMKLEKDSLTLADGQTLRNENGKTLKFYLNGHRVDELDNYSFQPLDKLLISYGSANDANIQKQINSVTNFAKDHQK